MGIPSPAVQHFLFNYKTVCEKHKAIIEYDGDQLLVIPAEEEEIEEHIDNLYNNS